MNIEDIMLREGKMAKHLLSHVRLFATPWTVAFQAPPSMGFSRQEYWSGLPFPSPGDLPNPGIEPGSPTLQADTLPSEPPGKLMLRESSHKKTNTAWIHLHEISKIIKFIETESRMWGEEKNEKIYLMHIAFQIYKMKISADWLHYRENILNTNKMYT